MLEYQFSYQDQKIRFTIDAMGREKCYLNDELIKKSSMNWLRRSVDVEFVLNDKTLRLNRTVTSFQAAEYQVSLFEGEELIEEQTKQYWTNEFSPNKSAVLFNKEERNWVQEIKPPQSIFNLAFLLYFITMIVDFFGLFGISEEANTVIAMVSISMIGLYATFTMVKLLANSFFIKVDDKKPVEESAI